MLLTGLIHRCPTSQLHTRVDNLYLIFCIYRKEYWPF
jgi:hypothetical protein